jgi:hypothetical protein
MDSLRPDRDDLDHYKSRKGGNKGAKLSTGKLSANQNGVKAKDDSGSRPIGAAGSQTKDARTGHMTRSSVSSNQSNSSSGSNFLVVALSFVIVLIVVGFSYLYWQQSVTIKGLESRLSSADEFIGQSKLLFARLEGEVSETGQELLQAGSSVDKKIAFLDSEVRKLWGVSYDRNRKTLQKHEKDIESLNKDVSANQKTLSSQSVEFSSVQSETKEGLSVLDGRVSSLSGELSITRAEQEESISALEQNLLGFELKSSELEQRLQDFQVKLVESTKAQEDSLENLSSIDESRRQLIKRVIDIEARLDKLSSASGAAKPSLQ